MTLVILTSNTFRYQHNGEWFYIFSNIKNNLWVPMIYQNFNPPLNSVAIQEWV